MLPELSVYSELSCGFFIVSIFWGQDQIFRYSLYFVAILEGAVTPPEPVAWVMFLMGLH